MSRDNIGRRGLDPEVVHAFDTLAAHGILDPWGIDDILEEEVVPELRAIRALLETGQVPGDGAVDGGIRGILKAIERNTASVVAPAFNKENLPIDVVGLTVEAIPEGGEGQALFEIEGSNFLATVRTTARAGQFDPVQVIGDNNVVAPVSPDVEDAFGGLVDAFVEPARFDRIETEDNVTIAPGDTETVIDFAVDNGQWLEVGTRDLEHSLYQYFVDDEALLTRALKEPLGLFNDPYVFPRPIKIEETARVDVTRQSSAAGSEEYFSKVTFVGEQ